MTWSTQGQQGSVTWRHKVNRDQPHDNTKFIQMSAAWPCKVRGQPHDNTRSTEVSHIRQGQYGGQLYDNTRLMLRSVTWHAASITSLCHVSDSTVQMSVKTLWCQWKNLCHFSDKTVMSVTTIASLAKWLRRLPRELQTQVRLPLSVWIFFRVESYQ